MSSSLMTSPLKINSERLWQSLIEMARFGATANNGVTRLTLTEEDRLGRDQLAHWAIEAGCTIRVDRLGNQFFRRAGHSPDLPPVLAGSHSDSQPLGGRFDGIYGVLGGLEVIRTLNDHNITTEHPIELVNWTNEEGSRFAPSMMASGVFAGVFTLEDTLARKDAEGISVEEALDSIGYAGEHPVEAFPIHAAFELHIEQGPILEAENLQIGVVEAAQGQRWYDAEIKGFSAHAGTTPMALRRDALVGFARIVEAVHTIGMAFAPHGRATIGSATISPGSRNVVPGHVSFSVEFRHPEEAALEEMEAALYQALEIQNANGLEVSATRIFRYAPIAFDQGCITSVRRASEALGYRHRPMISGAGHDSCYISRIAPTSMIFIPCVDGISHNEAEDIKPEWAEAGANVLLNAMLDKAGIAAG